LIPARLMPVTTATVNVAAVLFSVAVRVTSVVWVTLELVIWKVACVPPAGTETLAGIPIGRGVLVGVAGFVNAAVSAMLTPPAGAGGETVIVPAMLCPPATVKGTTTSEVIAVPVGNSVSCTESVVVFRVAVTVMVHCAVTGEV